MTLLIDVENLEVLAARTIVQPTSLQVCAGRPFTILGETGSGKSLLAQAIMGTLPDGVGARGRVSIAGHADEAGAVAPRRALWGRKIAILPQEPWLALDPTMPARAQVAEAYALVRGEPAPEARARAAADLHVLGLDGAGRKLPSQLSGGMAQRVAFAAARAGGATIVIADEPTKGLDASRRDEVVALLKRAADADGGLLTITHDVEVARRLGGEVAIMRDGEIVERGAAEEVLVRPCSDYGRRFLAADPAAWPMRTGSVGGAAILRAERLGKSRGDSRLFRGLDLSIGAGEIVGVTGPSGCGKTTLGDILLGLVAPDEGRVWRDPAVVRHRFQKLYQDPPAAFPPRSTLRRTLDDLLRRHGIDRAAVLPLMSRVRLRDELLDRRPDQLSSGELQRLALLRVLLLDPVFLFADEPTSRLDLITQQKTLELLCEVVRERRCAMLIVSHDLDLVSKVADRRIELS
jgi:peptide/nickel transport system ATP-binding protein